MVSGKKSAGGSLACRKHTPLPRGMVPDPMAQTVQWARRGQKGRAVRLVSVPGTCLTKSRDLNQAQGPFWHLDAVWVSTLQKKSNL